MQKDGSLLLHSRKANIVRPLGLSSHFSLSPVICLSVIILSPLSELRSAFSEKSESPFAAKRSLPTSTAIPTIITFANSDSKLVVGFDQGPIIVYDTSTLFSPGSEEIRPAHVFQSNTSTPPRQIVPNPSEESGLSELVAVIRDDAGTLEIFNVQKMTTHAVWRGEGPNTPASGVFNSDKE